jgi:hypothetical protein
MFTNPKSLPVEIPEAELRAKAGDLRFRFMIPRKNVDLAGTLVQDLSARFQAAAPIDQVTGREIVVSLDSHEPFQGLMIAVDVGEDEELHDFMIKKVSGFRG